MFYTKTIYPFICFTLFIFAIGSIAKSYTVSGTIFENDSVTTVPDVEVYAFARGPDDVHVPPKCVTQTKSNKNGLYTLTVAGAAQKYYIMGKCTDLNKNLGKRIKKWISKTTNTAHIYLKEAHDGFTTITGKITNTKGNPIPGAKVVLRTKISSGGTARFNIDSALTDGRGQYTIKNTQVMLPETVGEKVATLYFYAKGYDDGVLDPIEMKKPTMVIDYVMKGGTIIEKSESLTSKNIHIVQIHSNYQGITILKVSNTKKPSRIKLFTVKGMVLADEFIPKSSNCIHIRSIPANQMICIETQSANEKEVQTLILGK